MQKRDVTNYYDKSLVNNIWLRARQGDREAEQEIFRYLLVRFTLLAKRRLGEGEAEDVAQEACLTVLEKCRKDAPEDFCEAWAYAVLRNKIGNHLQTSRVRKRVMVGESQTGGIANHPEPCPNPDLRRRLSRCLKKILSVHPRYARALSLTYQGYRTDEICRRLGVKPGHLYVILNRGRQMLSDCLERGETGL